MVVSIIIRDINIVNNTFFEPVLRKDYISGITFDRLKIKNIVLIAFSPEDNHSSIIPVIRFFYHQYDLWRSRSIVRDTIVVKNNIPEP